MSFRPTILIFTYICFGLVCAMAYAQNNTKQILWTTDWSPNGKFIAVGGNTDTLNIYSQTLKPYKSIPIPSTITRIKFHPTKNIMAVATQLSTVPSRIINLTTNSTVELKGISSEGARGMDWNYTGEYLAIADNNGQIIIYQTNGALVRKIVTQNTKGITALAWHPKQNILVTVSDKIRMFDLNGTLLQTIKHRPEEVLLLSVVWHQSGDFFVTGDYGDDKDKSLLQYWDAKGNLLQSIAQSKGEYRNLSWNADGTRLASASDALRIWDTKGNLLFEGKSEDYLWGVSWNNKGNKIVTSSMEQNIILWNAKAEVILVK